MSENITKEYIMYGKQWAKEILKLKRQDIIDMFFGKQYELITIKKTKKELVKMIQEKYLVEKDEII